MIIFTAVHKRAEIFEIFLHHLPQYQLVVAGSSDDDCYNILQQHRPDATWVEAENEPLSNKFNAGLEALRCKDFDFVFITGSDDVFTPGLFGYYEMKRTSDYVGLLDFYFTDFQKTKYCPGFQYNRQGEPHGAGRMIAKWILEELDYKLWDDGLNSGLDASMTNRMRNIIRREHFFRCKDIGEIAIDLKTQNIQSMDDYPGEYVSNDILHKVLKPEVVW